MRYQGSKAKLAKYIIPIITRNLRDGRFYVEPFVGGCNMFSLIDTSCKIGSDSNEYVIEMWKAFQRGWTPPKSVTKDDYENMKSSYFANDGKYPKWVLGYVGNACSYGSSWWNGYANFNTNKNENHILEAYNGTMRQLQLFKYLEKSIFQCKPYWEIEVPDNAVVYCDPPYAMTKKYKDTFNSNAFWEWCRKTKAERNAEIYVSEYNAPEDFICLWERKRPDGMGTTVTGKKQKIKTEKLFTI